MGLDHGLPQTVRTQIVRVSTGTRIVHAQASNRGRDSSETFTPCQLILDRNPMKLKFLICQVSQLNGAPVQVGQGWAGRR